MMDRSGLLLLVLGTLGVAGVGGCESMHEEADNGADIVRHEVTPTRKPTGSLSVSVAVAEPGGKVFASLVRGPDGWSGNEPVEIFEVDASQSPVMFKAEGLAAGAYGLKLFQDKDGDGKLTTNAFGIPTEPYAFSNNAAGAFGPPAFEAAAFEIAADDTAEQAITLD